LAKLAENENKAVKWNVNSRMRKVKGPFAVIEIHGRRTNRGRSESIGRLKKVTDGSSLMGERL
jgi:hypothetical protein